MIDTLALFRYLVSVSYLEIYNEEVRDLLGKDRDRSLEVRLPHPEQIARLSCLGQRTTECRRVCRWSIGTYMPFGNRNGRINAFWKLQS